MTPHSAARAARRAARRRKSAVMTAALLVLATDVVVTSAGAVGDHHDKRAPVVGMAPTSPSTGGTTVSVTTAGSTPTTVDGVSRTTAGRAVGTGTAAPTDGTSPTTQPAVVSASGQCLEQACVTLDATTAIGPANHAGAGVNLLPGGSTSTSQMTLLDTNMYRSAPGPDGPVTSFDHLDWSAWDAAVQAGDRTTLILSNLWAQDHPGGPPPTPWSDWNTYNQWVEDTVRGIVLSGQTVDSWDVYNEPGWDNYYSASDFASETTQDLLTQFLDTYDDIKAVDPAAQIIGPSLGATSLSPHPANDPITHEPDITTFLDYAADHDLQLAAVAWHYNGQPPAVISALTTKIWALIRSLPALGNPQMFLDEYGDKATQPIPGWDVGFLAAITDGGFSSAVRSCWDACQMSTLDGLLIDGGSATTSEYYDRVTYAEMSGVMIKTSGNNNLIPALGSLSSSGQQITALIGRMYGCAVESWCQSGWNVPGTTPAAPMSVGVSVILPWSTPTAHVNLSYEPFEPGAAFSGPITAPAVNSSIRSEGGHEVLTFAIPAFADGRAYNLTVTPG